MANKKQVEIEVITDAKLDKVQALEDRINKLKQQQLQLNIETNTAKLDETKSRIESVKSELQSLQGKADVDDSEVQKLQSELDQLESDKINLELAIEKDKLESVKSEVEELDDTTIDIDVNNISAMEAVDQIGQGFDRLKQGASEVGQAMGDVLESAGRMEQTETFLSMNIGADQAKQKLEEIRAVTDKLPGDDVTLQNLLSQAAVKDISMGADNFERLGSAAADYMAAMQNFGKTSTETQQDLMNYILAGNTAEIERSPILQSHVDKLKEANTIEERTKALQEALNAEGWEGIASQDIYNNKLQQFNDMIERGKMNLGGMFLQGTEGAMQFLLDLDEATGGLVGMTVAIAGFASPLTDVVMGLGQMATGLRALKDAGDLIGLTDKLKALKATVIEVATSIKSTLVSALQSMAAYIQSTIIPAIRSAATALKELALKVLEAGYNALKSAAMWVAEKAAVVASTIAEYAMAAAQALLNAVMNMNPIFLVVTALIALAAALVWAYYNVDWFREMVDGAWQALQQFIGYIAGVVMGAIDSLSSSFNNAGQALQDAFTGAIQYVQELLQGLFDYITSAGGLIPDNVTLTGNQIIDSILGVMIFMATLPLQLAMIFINIIAQVLGFGSNFSQNMIQSAMQAVNGFIQHIATLPSRAYSYLSQLLSKVISWGSSMASQFLSAASKSVSNFASQIAQIPAKLGAELGNALNKVEEWAQTLPAKFWEAGVNAVKNFLSALGIASPGTMQRMLVWEVSEMGRRVPLEGRKLIDNIDTLGSDIVDTFNPELSLGFDDTANAKLVESADRSVGNVVNFYFTDTVVDNEDRMEAIADYITRRMKFDNVTAGRTV